MLLSVHVTSVLFLVWFHNFALTMGVTRSSHPFLYALALHSKTIVTNELKESSKPEIQWRPTCMSVLYVRLHNSERQHNSS